MKVTALAVATAILALMAVTFSTLCGGRGGGALID